MKKIYTIFSIAAGTLLIASCSGLNTTPKFEASESFAALTKSSILVDENKGSITLPVEIASIDPITTVVSYKLIDSTARAGVNFKDTNPTGVLTFANKSRCENIVIDIVDQPGEYTGDLVFGIELVMATGLKLSTEKTCWVTISDLDHPLAAILGDYAGSGVSYWDGAVSWTMTLVKDPKDVTVVWFQGLTNELMKDTQRFYANVIKNDDDEVVGFKLPTPQYAPYNSGTDAFLVGGDTSQLGQAWFTDILLAYDDGKITVEPVEAEDGVIDTFNLMSVTPDDHTNIKGWFNIYTTPISFVKK